MVDNNKKIIQSQSFFGKMLDLINLAIYNK